VGQGLQVVDHGEHVVEGNEDEMDDEDEVDDDDDSDEEDGDEDMMDVQETRPHRERPEPEIDEDGFTKVVGKKRR